MPRSYKSVKNFIVLSDNGSYADNRNNSFRNKLPDPIELKKKNNRMALVGFSYPHTWSTFTKNDNLLHVGLTNGMTINVNGPTGNFTEVINFLTAINTCMETSIEQFIRAHGKGRTKRATLEAAVDHETVLRAALEKCWAFVHNDYELIVVTIEEPRKIMHFMRDYKNGNVFVEYAGTMYGMVEEVFIDTLPSVDLPTFFSNIKMAGSEVLNALVSATIYAYPRNFYVFDYKSETARPMVLAIHSETRSAAIEDPKSEIVVYPLVYANQMLMNVFAEQYVQNEHHEHLLKSAIFADDESLFAVRTVPTMEIARYRRLTNYELQIHVQQRRPVQAHVIIQGSTVYVFEGMQNILEFGQVEVHVIDERDQRQMGVDSDTKIFLMYDRYFLVWKMEHLAIVDKVTLQPLRAVHFKDKRLVTPSAPTKTPAKRQRFDPQQQQQQQQNDDTKAQQMDVFYEKLKRTQFTYHVAHSRFQFVGDETVVAWVTLSKRLCYFLGFDGDCKIACNQMAKYTPDLHGGIGHLFVYETSGVTEPMIVGDTYANLMLYTTVEGQPGQYVNVDIKKPLWRKVVKNNFNEVGLDIRTQKGDLVPFNSGPTIATFEIEEGEDDDENDF